jgi:hypothetical protein
MLQFTEGTMNGRTPGYYKPIGDKRQGFRLTVPVCVRRADLYKFKYRKDGSLLYTPVV